MSGLHLDISTVGFSQMTRDLARIGGVPVERAVRFETGRILSLAAKRTPALESRKIREKTTRAVESQLRVTDSDKSADRSLTINLGRRGGAKGRPWIVDRNKQGQKVFIPIFLSNRRWNDNLWADYQAMLAEHARLYKAELRAQLARNLRSRGVTKQSWVQIADDLGLPIDVPAFVRRARHRDGRVEREGIGQIFQKPDQFFIEITNRNPILTSRGNVDGARILQGAIETRQKAFVNAVRHGVFDDLKARAQRYPGIFIS